MIGVISKALLRILGTFVVLLPALPRLWLGQGVGLVLRVFSIRKKIIQENLIRAYPGQDNEQLRQKLLGQTYDHLGHVIVEFFIVFGPFKSWVEKNAVLIGLEHWKKANDQGKGLFFLSSHVGNWEIMGARGALSGMDLMLVTKKLKPDWFHDYLEKSRLKCGVKGTYEPKTMRDILRHLKQGGSVGMILDQYAGPPVGVRVPFLNSIAGTSTALATLAKRTGIPVLPVVNYRTKDGRFVVEVSAPIAWIEDVDPHREIALNTASFVHVLESHIRAHPEQWLWSHRRFKGDLSPIEDSEWSRSRTRG